MFPGTHPFYITAPIEDYFGIGRNQIFQKTRKREIVRARQIAMWLITQENITRFGQPNYSATARFFGNFDRATVYAACRTVQRDTILSSYKKMLFDIQLKIFESVKYKDFQLF